MFLKLNTFKGGVIFSIFPLDIAIMLNAFIGKKFDVRTPMWLREIPFARRISLKLIDNLCRKVSKKDQELQIKV